MVLIHWIERGLGQILAPDENYKPDPDAVDTRSQFWTLVAPDPNFESESDSHEPNGAVRTPSSGMMNTAGFMSPPMQRIVSSSGATTTINESRNILMTPTPFSTAEEYQGSEIHDGVGDSEDVNARVLFTAKRLANCMSSPPTARKKVDMIFRYCASAIPLNEANQVKLRKLLTSEKLTIFQTRCSKMGHICPDGYSLMMAAAYSNHVVAAEILWELGPSDQLKEANLQGKTSYHIAAENGHMEILQFLQQKYVETYGITSPPPVDLTGMTPLGTAITSPLPNAIKQKQALYKQLFSPSDASIVGSPPPIQERVTYNTNLRIVYSVSQMPGKRILMEDSSVASCWEDTAAIFAVCDGHSDSGQVSRFVAESFPSKFQQTLIKYNFLPNSQRCDDLYWNTVCKDVCVSTDSRLKDANIPGGSTAVVAIVTCHEIVCANVGDCRCILIQTQQQQQKQESSASENLAEPTAVEPVNENNESNQYTVFALSDDHKANSDFEEKRIQNAGLQVVREKFIDNTTGQEVTISKVALTDKDRMACSRSFGDFEYKANTTLDPEEQAVVAVPDVVVRTRTPNDSSAFLVLACDGVWDVMSNDDVGQFVITTMEDCLNNASINQNKSAGANNTALAMVGDKLLSECFNRGSEDNLSCIIVALNNTQLMDKMGLLSRVSMEGKALDFTAAQTITAACK